MLRNNLVLYMKLPVQFKIRHKLMSCSNVLSKNVTVNTCGIHTISVMYSYEFYS